ncbi:hypothetical protein H0W26_05270 [Candidatus Dependentiae bacterium]|nr:hypothetical protein [Candidatus Dependentiae bacterium]
MIELHRTYTRRKYNSLFLSIAFHGLIMAFLFYWATAHKEHIPYFPQTADKSPAKITFQRTQAPKTLPLTQRRTTPFPSQPASSLAGAMPHRSGQTLPAKPNASQIPTQKSAPFVTSSTLQEKPLTSSSKKATAIQAESLTLPTNKSSHDKKELPVRSTGLPEAKKIDNEKSSKSSNPTMTPSDELTHSLGKQTSQDSKEQHPSQTTSSGISTRATAGRSATTGAALMNAFKRSFYSEHAGEMQQQTAEQGASSGYAHVTERLKEWDYSSYRGKISKALYKATRLHKKYISAPIAHHGKLSFNLVFNEEGSLRVDPLQPPTGIDELDTYITEFFLKIDQLPIPKRFNLKEFTERVTIQIKFFPGGFLQLVPINE